MYTIIGFLSALLGIILIKVGSNSSSEGRMILGMVVGGIFIIVGIICSIIGYMPVLTLLK